MIIHCPIVLLYY